MILEKNDLGENFVIIEVEDGLLFPSCLVTCLILC